MRSSVPHVADTATAHTVSTVPIRAMPSLVGSERQCWDEQRGHCRYRDDPIHVHQSST
jgi:hypothetical protein